MRNRFVSSQPNNPPKKLRRVDFIVRHPVLWPALLVVQCKWQTAKGRVEEKFPFETLNIERDGIPTINVLDRSGNHPGAEEWLRSRVGSGSLVGVMNFGELCRFGARAEYRGIGSCLVKPIIPQF